MKILYIYKLKSGKCGTEKNAIFFQDLLRKKTFFSTSFSQQVQLPDYSEVWIDLIFRFTEIENKRIRRKNSRRKWWMCGGRVRIHQKGETGGVVILWSKKGGYSLLVKFLENLSVHTLFLMQTFFMYWNSLENQKC